MDVTGQAFEDMQEQNSRLLLQLREKDDANFKLMSERIKSNQIYKLLKEEKEELADQVLTFKTQVTGALRHCMFFFYCVRSDGALSFPVSIAPRWMPSCWWSRSWKRKRASCRARWQRWRRSWPCERKRWSSTRER